MVRGQLFSVIIAISFSAVCYMYAIVGSDAVTLQQKGAFAPGSYIALVGVGLMLLIHVPAFAVYSSVCYEGDALAGVAPPEMPSSARR